MSNNKMTSKKVYQGLYLCLGKYISVYQGTSHNVWNIFNDYHCTDEYAVGFYTKQQAMEYLYNKLQNVSN